MKEFFKKLLSDSGDISSKRFSGVVSLFTAIVLSFVDLIKPVNEHYFDGFLYFAAASLGLTIADNFIKTKSKTEVAIAASNGESKEEVKKEEVVEEVKEESKKEG